MMWPVAVYTSWPSTFCPHLKGQCHKIFDFWYFSWINIPQAPEYTIRAVSIFFRKLAEIFAAQGAPPVLLTPKANLPPVSLIPVVHLDLRIFDKIRNSPNGILWGWGKLIHEKKLEAKNLVTLPFNTDQEQKFWWPLIYLRLQSTGNSCTVINLVLKVV